MGDIGGEHVTIHCPVKDHRSNNARGAKRSHQCCRLPVAVRNTGTTPFATSGAASTAGHLGIGAAFINEEQPLDLKVILTFKPALTRGFYIIAILLTGMGSLFLTV